MADRPVNFVYNNAPDYRKVQDQIFGLIRVHLPPELQSETIEERRDDAINFGIHIRKGRGAQSRPMPIDVLMSHGLADKSYLLASGLDGRRLINNYSHVIVPGQWFASRLLRRNWHPIPRKRVTLSKDGIHIGGWPRLDPLLAAKTGEPRAAGQKPRLLWAPSHNISRREQSFSSYPAFEEYLEPLEQHFEVRVSLHPSNRTDKSPTTGDLGWADVVVSDFGTMLYEAWALGKCVVMPSWLMPKDIRSWNAEGHVYRHKIGNHAQSFDHLVSLALANEAPGDDVRAFMDRILDPKYRGTASKRVAELLLTLPLVR